MDRHTAGCQGVFCCARFFDGGEMYAEALIKRMSGGQPDKKKSEPAPDLERGRRSVEAWRVELDRYERNPKKGKAKPGIHWSEQRDADAYLKKDKQTVAQKAKHE